MMVIAPRMVAALFPHDMVRPPLRLGVVAADKECPRA